MKGLFPAIDTAYAAAMVKLSTPMLTRVLLEAVEKQPPPRSGMYRPKLRYAHQGGSNPPLIIIHGSALKYVSKTYQRYLENSFRKIFKLEGTPLRVEFKTGHNPFADKKPGPLSEAEATSLHRQRRSNRKKYGQY
jgi:GTP-binding protein